MVPSSVPVDRPPRILICAVHIPFVTGGAEHHIESLRRELEQRNYEVDVVRVPLKWYPPRQIINNAMAWRFLDLSNSYGMPVDLVIATRFPSYVIRHPRKIAWVLHQHRQAYDLLNTELTDFKDTPDDDHARKLLYELDRRSLKECTKLFANSKNVAQRMKKYLGIDSIPLYHPPPLYGQYRNDSYGDFVLSVGRLEKNKRIDLLIQSLAKTKNPIHVKIAGKGPQMESLIRLARELGIEDRVTMLGFVNDEELIGLYASCGAVYYAPHDEDYGYITLEALLSGKTVITASDSGGVLEFIERDVTGFVGESTPESLANEMDRWWETEDKGKSLGLRGKQTIELITWDNVIEQLTESLRNQQENK